MIYSSRYVNPIMCLECHEWFTPNGSGAICENCRMKQNILIKDRYEK